MPDYYDGGAFILGHSDPAKLTERLAQIAGPATGSNVAEAVAGRNLVVRATITRCCMQSHVWYAGVVLSDAATNATRSSEATKRG